MPSARQFKDRAYAELARVGKAVAAPKRLELLDLLCQGPRTVEALAEQAALSVANASQHLKLLRAAGLVEATKRGLFVEYRVADDQVVQFFHALHSLADERLAEVRSLTRSFLEESGALEAVSSSELLKRVRKGEVTLVDVRPPLEYQAGHIPGALSLPLPELKKRLDELPKDRDVVAYCRGPRCVLAIEAVQQLRKKGFVAARLDQGVIEWKSRGWRLETGAGT